MRILDFFESDMRNAWIEHGGQSLYLRKALHWIGGPEHLRMIDIANVETPEKKQGKGRFKQNLAVITGEALTRGYDGIYIENVLSDRFAEYFRREKWIELDMALTDLPCFYRVFI
jgi:hypothetical protein